MKEDIKIIEECKIMDDTIPHSEHSKRLRKAIENLLNGHKKLEEEISSREKSHMDLYNDFKHYIQYESIPISVIQNKIDKKLEEDKCNYESIGCSKCWTNAINKIKEE